MKPNKASELPIDDLRRLLAYNPKTGEILWNTPPSRHFRSGAPAGSLHRQGYRRISLGGYDIPAHRIAFALFHGRWPTDLIDHINGIKADNRIENLREASHSGNNQNRPTPRNNTSGVKGVCWRRSLKKWRAEVYRDKIRYCLGHFINKQDAIKAVTKARERIHGEFCRHN